MLIRQTLFCKLRAGKLRVSGFKLEDNSILIVVLDATRAQQN